MKTIKLLFIGLAVLSLGLFTSCEDDGEATAPTIEFVAGEGFITANATVTVDVPFTFKWNVSKGSADLESFTIRLGALDMDGYPKTDIDQDFYQGQQVLTIVSPSVYTYTFIATDEDGLTDTKTITITAVAAAGDILTYSDKLLGSHQATQGSSFASVDGLVYLAADAKANSSKIDFVYFYGATNLATLSAPGTTEAQDVFNNATTGIATWTVKNETLMAKTTLTATQFDAITTDAEIVTAASALTTVKKVNSLATGDVVVFETASTSANPSKKGLIKIGTIVTGADGNVTVTVKVQE